MGDRRLLGMLTPSSNTVLEPVTTAILASLPEVSAHFSRFRVTEISLTPQALSQFDVAPILQAAELLADAHVDVIAWNGTSAGWLGFERDVELCDRITAATGIPATTSLLALLTLCQSRNLHEIGLVTPYITPVQERIVANFAEAGIQCSAEQHLNLSVNFEFSEVSEATLTNLVKQVAATQPAAILTFCTNLRAAPLAAKLEPSLGLPLLDSTAAAVWQALAIAGGDPAAIQGWGRMFTDTVATERSCHRPKLKP
jgi:maleate isomerase